MKILLVEDNADSAEAMLLLLREFGHDVRVVHDGLEAVGAAQAFDPEVVLLDIGLPDMDGYEVARRLRQQPGLSATLLVALTGYGRDEDRDRAREAGFDHHLTKPVDPTALEGLVARRRPE